MTLTIILSGVGSAILASCFTLLGSYLLFRASLKARLYQEIDELAELMKARLREGVIEAGRELKPDFRDEVREGFKEAMGSALSGEIIEQAARKAAQNSTSIVEQGLNMLLGRPPEKK
ncbi:MAG: hypothetical protein K1X75_04665 [Leptospirales bacterium]|nr:hypothetical protein [Leptospirales bacterium]